jgi:hypothetical protein
VFYRFCNKIGVKYTDQQIDHLNLWLSESQECHWWWPYEGIVVFSDRPTHLTVDAQGRLHNETRKCIEYADGWGFYASHGVALPEFVIERPHEITVKKIAEENNAEVRRVMVDKMGRDRFLKESRAKKLATDDFGTLWEAFSPDRGNPIGERRMMFVEVINSTAEPDGSFKNYILRVDPEAYGGLKTARAAVASTWRKQDGSMAFVTPEEYSPLVET